MKNPFRGSDSLKEMSESDRVHFFIDDVLAPIVSADGIDDVESKALNSAWFLYRMDESYRKEVFKKLVDTALQTRTNVDCAKTLDDIRGAFRRICTMADEATYNEFVTLIDWCNERARHVGGALFSCRETSRWAEEHFHAKLEDIRRTKAASADATSEYSDSTTKPNVDTIAGGAGSSAETVAGTAEIRTSTAPGPEISQVGENVQRDVEKACASSKNAISPLGEVSGNGPLAKPIVPPCAVKSDADKPLDPPRVVHADVPADFWQRLQGRMDKLLQDLPRCALQILDELGPVDRAQDKMLFRESRGDRLWKVFPVRTSETPLQTATWIIGDVHGDLLAFESALQYVESQGGDPRIVFLGDLFDRGLHSSQVVLRFLQELTRRPGHICLLAGNHDVGMSVDARAHPYTFRSIIDPSDYVETLNAHRHQDELHNEIGRTICGVSHGAPRAIFFEDGLFLAHGGIPQADMWEGMKTVESLNADMCLTDFTFRRTKQSKRSAGISRHSDYYEFGFRDFCGFCHAAEKALGFLPKQMVRGHDHVDANARFEVFEKWGNRLVTISNLCYSQPGSDTENRKLLLLDYVRQPAIVKTEYGKAPEVHVLRIPAALASRYYPESVEFAPAVVPSTKGS